MKIIDLLNKKQNKEKGYFKFYVISDEFCSKKNCINWSYDNGEITTYDEDDFYDFLKDDIYSLYSEVEIIEEDKEIEELDAISYYDETKTLYQIDYEKAQDKINELIKTVNELKKGK